jgi:60 kDa SS-A/Ro ribonucleoprotein
MANKSLFASLTSRLPPANAVNEAGGRAYKLEPKHALAQVAATGTFGNAFYSTAETQLDEVLKLIDEVDDNQYLAKLALYARDKAFMKDMPAALLVALSVRDTELLDVSPNRFTIENRSGNTRAVSSWPNVVTHI